MNNLQPSDEQQLRIVQALLARPNRPKHWALWWEGGKLWERTGLQGKAQRLAWFDAADMVGMRSSLPSDPRGSQGPMRRNRSIREIRESLRADLERMGVLPATNPE